MRGYVYVCMAKKYVYEVYKERSFTKAAQNLYISQPSLSARIKKMEVIIGEPLFDRSTTPLQLTEVGKVYIEAAEEITQIEQRVENYINDLAGLKTGNLAVGASTLFAAYVVPSLITQFNQKFPDVHIQLIEGNTAELEEMLGSNALEFLSLIIITMTVFYIIKNYIAKKIYYLQVPKHFAVNEELGMYQLSYKNIKNKNYLNQKYPAVPLGRFADLPFIMLTQGNDTRTRGDRLCRNVGFKPNIVLEFNQQSTAYMASSTQLGATFISDILVSQLPTFENLVYYKLDGEEAKRKVFFYYKTHKYKTRVMEEFVRMMHEQI